MGENVVCLICFSRFSIFIHQESSLRQLVRWWPKSKGRANRLALPVEFSMARVAFNRRFDFRQLCEMVLNVCVFSIKFFVVILLIDGLLSEWQADMGRKQTVERNNTVTCKFGS